eukprot:jgi/Mesvir1/19474/Mv10495-RA.1
MKKLAFKGERPVSPDHGGSNRQSKRAAGSPLEASESKRVTRSQTHPPPPTASIKVPEKRKRDDAPTLPASKRPAKGPSSQPASVPPPAKRLLRSSASSLDMPMAQDGGRGLQPAAPSHPSSKPKPEKKVKAVPAEPEAQKGAASSKPKPEKKAEAVSAEAKAQEGAATSKPKPEKKVKAVSAEAKAQKGAAASKPKPEKKAKAVSAEPKAQKVSFPREFPPYQLPNRQTRPVAPGYHWSDNLLSYMQNPELFKDWIFWADDESMVIFDAYPKARAHLLVMPRPVPDRGLIQEIYSMSREHLGLLDRLEEVGRWLVKGLSARPECAAGFYVGFHGSPSMKPLHMHVISRDMDSECMKSKRHWNSSTSANMVTVGRLRAEIERHGSFRPELRRLPADSLRHPRSSRLSIISDLQR